MSYLFIKIDVNFKHKAIIEYHFPTRSIMLYIMMCVNTYIYVYKIYMHIIYKNTYTYIYMYIHMYVYIRVWLPKIRFQMKYSEIQSLKMGLRSKY